MSGHRAFTEVRRQFRGLRSVFQIAMLAWQVPLPTEPSHQPTFEVLTKFFLLLRKWKRCLKGKVCCKGAVMGYRRGCGKCVPSRNAWHVMPALFTLLFSAPSSVPDGMCWMHVPVIRVTGFFCQKRQYSLAWQSMCLIVSGLPRLAWLLVLFLLVWP